MSYFIFHCYSGELKRKDDLLASMDKKQDEAREKMQEVIIRAVVCVSYKAQCLICFSHKCNYLGGCSIA